MRLAMAFGRPLYELGEMPSEEFTLWLAYDELDGIPWPWLQTGIVAATLCNVMRTKKGRPAQPREFMPVRQRRREQTAEEQMAIIDGMARRMGAAARK
jgi:hypothetical protein